MVGIMNKTDRLLAIILELQSKGIQRAEDLAATFETSRRTIYRDIQALSEANVPIISSPGQGYCLLEGYFLPPVCLTTEEAITLSLGIDFVEQQFDQDYRIKARVARAKIEAILPRAIQEETARVRQGLKLINSEISLNVELQLEALASLRRAVLEERKVHFHYMKGVSAANDERHSTRTVDPYALVYVNNSWALIAFCNLRNSIRHFRLSRMTELQLLEEKFIRPTDFQLRSYKPVDDRHTLVRVLIDSKVADQWTINSYYYTESIENNKNSLLVTLRVRTAEEVLPWVLSFGANAEILEPDSLKKLIRDHAENILKRY